MAKYFSPEIETASRDYLHAIQSARLIKTVKRCYENIPFYKAKFDEIGLKPEDIHSIDDISKLPFTVKQDLRYFRILAQMCSAALRHTLCLSQRHSKR